MNKYRIWFVNERGQTEKLKMVSLSLEESDLFTFGSIVRLFENVEHNSAMVNGLEVTEVHIEKVLENKKIFKPGDRVIYIGGNRKYNRHIYIEIGEKFTVMEPPNKDFPDDAIQVMNEQGAGAIDSSCFKRG